jgi:DNA-binding CsgD family transcriptional regulator
MVREQQVLDLIGRIYDAALDATRWTSVLHDLVKLTSSNTGNIAELDFANGATRGIAAVDIPEKAFSDYAAYHWQKDIWTPKPGTFEIGRALNSQQHVPDHVLIRSEIYNDWMKPLRLFYGLGGIPLVEGSKMLLIGVHRPWSRQRPYGDREIRLLQQLFPHLKRALQIRHRLDRATVEREAFVETTEHVPRGIFTFGADGRLHWANRTGQEFCRQADGLTLRQSRLTTALPAETQHLHQLIHQTFHTTNGESVSGGGALLVSRPSGLRPYIVLVSPLRTGRRRLDDRQPAAVVFVSDPERVPEVPLDRLMRLYGLTQAEARLAQQLAAGHDLKEIAAATHRTMNTVRTQLKQAFQKTGTSRQAQLVRLVLQMEGAMNGHS